MHPYCAYVLHFLLNFYITIQTIVGPHQFCIAIFKEPSLSNKLIIIIMIGSKYGGVVWVRGDKSMS